jgi:hypothetical protein
MTKIHLYAAGALLAFSTVPANAASFTGQQIKTTWRLPTETTAFALSVSPSSVFVAGNGVEAEAQLNAVRFLIDFGENDIAFIFLTDAIFSTNSFNGIYFDALSGGGFGTVDTVSGIAANRIHNLASALSVNFSGQHYLTGDKVTINFTPSIPEPASWTMLIAGLGMAGAVLRRRAPRQRVAFS